VFIPVRSVTVADPPRISMAGGLVMAIVSQRRIWLTANDDIGSKTEEHEDDMGDGTPTGFDDLEEPRHVSAKY
jgi:hypothetical protein